MFSFRKIIILIFVSQNHLFSMEQNNNSESEGHEGYESLEKIIPLPRLRTFDFNKPLSAYSKTQKELNFNRENIKDVHYALRRVINILDQQNTRLSNLENENKYLKKSLDESRDYISIFANYGDVINLLNKDDKMEFCKIMTSYLRIKKTDSIQDMKNNALSRICFILRVSKEGNALFTIALRDFAFLYKNKNNSETKLEVNSLKILKTLKLINIENGGLEIEEYIKDIKLDEIILEAQGQYLKLILGIY